MFLVVWLALLIFIYPQDVIRLTIIATIFLLGGYLNVKVAGHLKLDGSFVSNGLNSLSQNGGGASGGSIHIVTSSITGLGKVLANGGNGISDGNGGGGGCIAVHVDNKHSFQGIFQSYGGNGKVVGGAGTVYIEDSKSTIARSVQLYYHLVCKFFLFQNLPLIFSCILFSQILV